MELITVVGGVVRSTVLLDDANAVPLAVGAVISEAPVSPRLKTWQLLELQSDALGALTWHEIAGNAVS